jgi:hypothetical protein
MQFKLILGGLIVIFSTESQSNKFSIINTFVFLFSLIIYVLFYKTKPCSVKIVNQI